MEKIKSLSDNRSIFPNEVSLRDTINPAELNEEESLIAKTIEKFVLKQVTSQLDALETHDYHTARQLFSDAGELGILGADVPVDYGGLAMGKEMVGVISVNKGISGYYIVVVTSVSGVSVFL